MDRYYDTERPLPADDFEHLAKVILATKAEEKAALKQVLSEFFVVEDGFYRNARCDKEIAKFQALIAIASKAGKASAARRFNKKVTRVQRSMLSGSTNQNQNQNQEPINETPSAIALPDWLDKEKWQGYVKTRKPKARQPEALKAAIEKLEGFRAAGHDPNEIVATSLANGWAGLFEPKTSGGGNGKFHAVQYSAQQLAKSLGGGSTSEIFDDLHGEVHPVLPRPRDV